MVSGICVSCTTMIYFPIVHCPSDSEMSNIKVVRRVRMGEGHIVKLPSYRFDVDFSFHACALLSQPIFLEPFSMALKRRAIAKEEYN